jgi:hypothetical protein
MLVLAAATLATTGGCSDGPYAAAGSGGFGGSGTAGAGDAGTSGTGGDATGDAGTSGTGATGAGDGGGGGSGSAGGPGGSIGGSIGPGVAGSIGTGAGGSAAGSTAGTTGGASGAGGGVGGSGGASGAGGGVAGTGGTGQAMLQAWPGTATVVAVDSLNQFPNNLSDLVYQPPAGGAGDVLWAVMNDPSVIYSLTWNGTTWVGITDNDWTNGKTIHYPNGNGSPDSEGLARAEWSSTAIYVASERNNDDSMVSRLSVLRYDTAAAGTSLTATHEWNLTSDLPPAGANLGLEGIAWIPDTTLVASGFFDEAANAAYDPSRYPNHGTGLFFVGLENNGFIYGFALDHSGNGAFQRVATISSGHSAIMSLDFDRDEGNLWAYCDNGCGNQATVLRIGGSGRFEIARLYNRAPTLADSNNEGITIAPDSECVQGQKSFFWADDDANGGHAIYRGSIPCGALP